MAPPSTQAHKSEIINLDTSCPTHISYKTHHQIPLAFLTKSLSNSSTSHFHFYHPSQSSLSLTWTTATVASYITCLPTPIHSPIYSQSDLFNENLSMSLPWIRTVDGFSFLIKTPYHGLLEWASSLPRSPDSSYVTFSVVMWSSSVPHRGLLSVPWVYYTQGFCTCRFLHSSSSIAPIYRLDNLKHHLSEQHSLAPTDQLRLFPAKFPNNTTLHNTYNCTLCLYNLTFRAFLPLECKPH